MNIVARVHLYPPEHCAGAEMMLHQLLKALVERGHRVDVHLSRMISIERPYHLDGVKIVPRRRSPAESPWFEAAADADVLITHLDNTSTVIRAAIALDRPLVQVLHNTHAPTRMWASCRNDLLVYNSDWMRREMGDHLNGIVVRPPVHVEDYRVEPTGYAVTLINTTQAKGGVVFAQLAALMPDVEFIGVHGAYGEQLDPHLSNVDMRPHSPDVRSVYRDTKILIMPSTYESWGRTAVEAMSSGIPVVATATPGLCEAIGKGGVLMHPFAQVDEWQATVRRLLDDEIEYDRLSLAAVDRAAELDPTAELAAFCDRVEALA